jgi:hypothetical protein
VRHESVKLHQTMCMNKNEKAAPVHGARTGHETQVEQSKDENGAKTRITLRDVLPRQVRPVLVD